MNIQEFRKKVVDLESLSVRCAKEYEEWAFEHTREKEDVHYCRDMCPISNMCKTTYDTSLCSILNEALTTLEKS